MSKLQEIKHHINSLSGFEDAPNDALYYLSKEHINWLIEQAEKADALDHEKLQLKTEMRSLLKNSRRVFQLFMKHELSWACEEGFLDLSDDDIEKIVFFAEDDINFHLEFIDFVKDYLEWNGDDIGLDG
ncbi:MAG: hypothetical protein N2043_01500 [Ignavibacterium sp.]|nr:hypothetical protein [Ignavibacterium sp.]